MEQKVIIDLDMLLDTRIVTLGKYLPDVAANIIKGGTNLVKYSDRLDDNFTYFGLEPGVFSSLYNARTTDDLQYARPTRFLFELRNIATQVINHQLNSPHSPDDDITFYINYYPYTDLTEAELEYITGAVLCRLPAIIKVETVCLKPSDLNSIHIRDSGITAMYIYDFNGWLKANYSTDVDPKTIVANPAVTVNAPLWIANIEKLKELADFENPRGEKHDPIQGIAMMFVEFFAFEPMSSIAVSLMTPEEFVILEEALRQNADDNKPNIKL